MEQPEGGTLEAQGVTAVVTSVTEEPGSSPVSNSCNTPKVLQPLHPLRKIGKWYAYSGSEGLSYATEFPPPAAPPVVSTVVVSTPTEVTTIVTTTTAAQSPPPPPPPSTSSAASDANQQASTELIQAATAADSANPIPATILPIIKTEPEIDTLSEVVNSVVWAAPLACTSQEPTGSLVPIPPRKTRKRRKELTDEDKRFRCSYCDKAFTARSSLDVHERIHTGDRPYKCESCGKTFRHCGHLTCHMRTHTGERPYVCRVCGKGFTQSTPCRRHEQTQHNISP